MVDDNILNKALKKIKEIKGIEKFDDTKILIDAGDKFPDDIILRNVVILMICNIKNGKKFYPQLFLEKALPEAYKIGVIQQLVID